MRITITKASVIAYVSVFLMTLACVAAILLTSSILLHIIVIWVLCFTAFIIARGDIMHPYCWFSAVLTLYSSSYAMLILLGFNGHYSKEQLLYPVIALGTALLFIGPHSYQNSDSHFFSTIGTTGADYRFLDIFIYVLSAAALIISVILLGSGYSGKVAMKSAGNIYYRFGVYVVRYLVFFMIIRMSNCIVNGKKYFPLMVVTVVATLTFTFSTGERDVFIRFFVVVMFVLFSAHIIKRKHFLILIPISMVVLTLSVEFKYFFLRGTLQGSFSLNNLLEGFLSSDFSAAGRNLQYLLENSGTNGQFGFRMLITELLYPILPSSWRTNPDHWFNYDLHTGNYHGYAFTLVGTGYIIHGVIGIILVFAIVGLIVRFLYKNANRGIFLYAAYVYSITIIMISMRGSLNSIVNCLVKEVAVGYILCRVFIYFLNSGKNRSLDRNRRSHEN